MDAQELALLLMPEVRKWIQTNKDEPAFRLALRRPPSYVPPNLAIQQVSLLQKAATKLPSWYEALCVIPPRAYEQATSETLASIKPWGAGVRALDLSCGLGSDVRMIAQRYAEVIAVEPDPVVATAVRFNQELMGLKNVTLVETTAEDFLASYDGPPFDLIYLDPDRRDEKGRRKYGLADCQPDVLQILPRLSALSRHLLIKVSPMLDIQALEKELPQATMLWVLAENNECKEILVEFGEPNEDGHGRGVIFRRKAQAHRYTGNPISIEVESAPAYPAYILEADVSLYKSDLATAWFLDPANGMEGQMSSPTGFFFTDEVQPGFHGHTYKVMKAMPFKPDEIRRYCKSQGIHRIQFTRRDFEFSIDDVREQIGILEGGNFYLVLTNVAGVGRMAYMTQRV